MNLICVDTAGNVAAGCSITYEQASGVEHGVNIYGTTYHRSFTNYRFTAHAGYRCLFKQFDFVLRYTYHNGRVRQESLAAILYNPYPTSPLWTEYYVFGDCSYTYDPPGDAPADFPDKTEIVEVRATFSRTDPTNLLVNSFNRSSPVTLVYDPTTNQLVADY